MQLHLATTVCPQNPGAAALVVPEKSGALSAPQTVAIQLGTVNDLAFDVEDKLSPRAAVLQKSLNSIGLLRQSACVIRQTFQ